MNPSRLTSLVVLTVVAFMHYRDIPGKLGETPYLGWMYILLVAGCAAAGAWLLSTHWRQGYALGTLISLGAIIGFVLTRTTGLPNATGDIGNWGEPAGIISLVAEAAFVALSVTQLRMRPQLISA
ncbi:hypothetical protein EHF33_15085 [Deinococcus psychrotolerans]|uniref:Uncharacterized protein n=1 Tax=Deinococcus psychrotolerans TaxID=2489213 RepID=A0A3G8YR69_9DEIO|nr:hypothetical protein [Deinococcus psychrotolerans]AZI44221.1 hypothetical protein EHF33_15085 [Deinococcus psychrotolerans]